MPASKNGNKGPLLLDTHVWLWAVEGIKGKISRAALQAIRLADAERRTWVSVFSVWELAMLEKKGRIKLSRNLRTWVESELAQPGLNLIRLEPSIAMESVLLPDSIHADPADRILIASAQHLGAVLVTADRAILSYGSSGHLKVLDARA